MSAYHGNPARLMLLTLALLLGQNLPSGHDNTVEYLQAQVYKLSASSSLEAKGGVGHKHLVCGYVASCKILSTNSQASGSSLNCGEA